MKSALKNAASRLLEALSSNKFLTVIYVWFLIQTIYIVINVKVGIPPDENWHLGLIQLYTRDGLDPAIQDQTGFFYLGEVTRGVGYYYHYLLSIVTRPLDAMFSYETVVSILRMINVFMGLGTLIIVSNLTTMLKFSKLVRNIVVFCLANTAMFVFLSGSVNYDNLLILVSVFSVYSLMKLIDRFSINNLLIFLAAVLFGLQVKFAYAPLALFLVLVLFFELAKNYKVYLKEVSRTIKKAERSSIAFATLVVVLLVTFAFSYGRNIVEYQTVAPKCTKVHSLDNCLQSEVFARNQKFKAEPLSGPLMTKEVFSYRWFETMQERLFGVFAHKSYKPSVRVVQAINVVMLLGLVCFVRLYKHRDNKHLYILLLALFYTAILLMTNWGTYSRSGRFGVALQGRYILPVLPLIYMVLVGYIFKMFNSRIVYKLLISLIICALFFLSSAPAFISNTDEGWFKSSSITK